MGPLQLSDIPIVFLWRQADGLREVTAYGRRINGQYIPVHYNNEFFRAQTTELAWMFERTLSLVLRSEDIACKQASEHA